MRTVVRKLFQSGNFRHLPIIAKALDSYQGASLMVSHIPDFVSQIRIDETIDLSAL